MMTEEEVSAEIERELKIKMGIGIPRYIIGSPYAIVDIDSTKDKKDTDQGMY